MRVAGGVPDSCDGLDRPTRLGGSVRYRHFFCYFARSSDGGNGFQLPGYVARIEVHTLPDGRTVRRNLLRHWLSTPPWLDDRPADVGSLVGVPLARAAAILEARGYDYLFPGPRGSYETATRSSKDVMAGVLVCAQTRRGVGRATVIRLVLGFRRCVGPPYLPPITPNLRGMSPQRAIAALAARGIDFSGGEPVDVSGTTPVDDEEADGWVVCRQIPAAGKRAWGVELRIALTLGTCKT